MRLLFILCAALMLASCGSSDTFQVTVDIDDLGIEAVEMSYPADGSMRTIRGRAKNAGDEVVLKGASEAYTLVEIRRANGAVIAAFPARNGDKIRLKMAAGAHNPTLAGTAAVDSLTAFTMRNAALIEAGPSPRLSERVASFVTANPALVTSTFLLTTMFDASEQPALADSLLSRLDPEARAPGVIAGWAEQLQLTTVEQLARRLAPMTFYGASDSAMTFVATTSPHSLLVFVNRERPDSVSRTLRKLRADYPAKRLKIMEVTLSTDSLAWNRANASDTARWTRAWIPGGVSAPVVRRLSIHSAPFFIVADSTGTQLYRGTSASQAAATVNKSAKH